MFSCHVDQHHAAERHPPWVRRSVSQCLCRRRHGPAGRGLPRHRTSRSRYGTGGPGVLWDALPHACAEQRTQVHRHPERGDYDRATIDQILDEALICHVAFNDGDGAPRCLPTIHARVGDTIYLHGSTAARAWKALRAGAEVCIVATIVDGLVMARSAFNHSMNYRSVVVFGTAREVTEEEELHTAADRDHLPCRPRPRR